MGKFARILFIVILLAVIGKSGYELFVISGQYSDEANAKDSMMSYRPGGDRPSVNKNKSGGNVPINGGASGLNVDSSGEDSQNAQTPGAPTAPGEKAGSNPGASSGADIYVKEPIVNQSIIDMQNEVNADIIGWITVPGTLIDYPFVVAKDNDFYLKRNIYKEQAAAGAIFMDCRNAPDFSDFNTILYGHNMKNRSMFGDLRSFADFDYLEASEYGTIFIKDNTFTLVPFACLVIKSNDAVIYDPSAESGAFYDYIKQNAREYREPDPAARVVTLSTCSYEFNNARTVLIANIYD